MMTTPCSFQPPQRGIRDEAAWRSLPLCLSNFSWTSCNGWVAALARVSHAANELVRPILYEVVQVTLSNRERISASHSSAFSHTRHLIIVDDAAVAGRWPSALDNFAHIHAFSGSLAAYGALGWGYPSFRPRALTFLPTRNPYYRALDALWPASLVHLHAREYVPPGGPLNPYRLPLFLALETLLLDPLLPDRDVEFFQELHRPYIAELFNRARALPQLRRLVVRTGRLPPDYASEIAAIVRRYWGPASHRGRRPFGGTEHPC